jgi:hypothetical protein
MAKQTINIGTTANDKTGDPLRTAFNKVNQNFTELYNGAANESQLINSGYTLTINSGGALVLSSGIAGILKGVSGVISTATAGVDYIAPYGSNTANYVLASPSGSAGVPSFRALAAADIPATLNSTAFGTASSTADADATVDASTTTYYAYVQNTSSTTRTISISNLTAGRMVQIYLRNTFTGSKVINITSSTTTNGFAAVNMSVNSGTASATSVTLAATSGTAVITIFNANGTVGAGIM